MSIIEDQSVIPFEVAISCPVTPTTNCDARVGIGPVVAVQFGMTETKMDFPEVDKLLGELSRARDAVGGGAKNFGEASETLGWNSYTTVVAGSVGSWSVPQPELVFGDTEGGGQCWSAHYECKIVMDTVLPAFANTLDSDVERLKTAVALFHQTDGENADRMLQAARGGLDVVTARSEHGRKP